MKYIYTWHEGTHMYSVRMATEQEENRISTAIRLLKKCKKVHQSIINDAYSHYNGDIDRFIDDEAYYVVKELHNDLDNINKLTEGLIELATDKYYFFNW